MSKCLKIKANLAKKKKTQKNPREIGWKMLRQSGI